MAGMVKRCAILFVSETGCPLLHKSALQEIGFTVECTSELPDGENVRQYESVVVVLPDIARAPMIGARLRARRYFERRVLIGLVPDDTPEDARRDAVLAGYDDLMLMSCSGRDVGARILRALRLRPEHQCRLVPRQPRAA